VTYETIPFLNRWGHINLGEWRGGVSLLFKEAVAGVINWSIAAWLFAINRTFLSAALDRSSAPIRFLFTREGFIQLIQHMIEVMRWGLWMSPIIFSFLRMMGEPTWYNQDGAIRTVFATVNSLTMSPENVALWSLNVFVALLAYDLVRILIWIDHMGLRVATLVNFSFLGMDKIDGWLSRFIGRDATARYIPDGVKRFTTWAPLLIPFYIPMGANWDYVWEKSAEVRAASGGGIYGWLQSLSPGGGFLVALLAIPLATAWFAALRRMRTRQPKEVAQALRPSNRSYEVVLKPHGECFSHLPKLGYDLGRRA
jgi:cyclic beta-1,2-glucan synthetase